MIIGNSLTALGGGLKPEICVTAKAGALLNLHYKGSTIILQSFQLGATEMKHTFVVSVSDTAYVIDDVTNGKRAEVLVDAVAVFDVAINYGTLYDSGNEYEGVTGGWVFPSFSDEYDSYRGATLIREKQDNSIYIYCNRPYGQNGNYAMGSVRTTDKIDVSGYSRLYLEYEDCSFTTEEDFQPRFGASAIAQDGVNVHIVWAWKYQAKIPSGSGTISIDISDATEPLYVMVTTYAYGKVNNTSTVKIKRVWLG